MRRFVTLLLLFGAISLPALAQVDCAADVDHNAAGQAAIVDSDFATAIEEYTCTIDADPDNYEAYVGRTLAKYLTNDFRGAFYDSSIVLTQGYAALYAAIDQYTTLIDADPTATLYAARGVLHWIANSPQRARDDMNWASTLGSELVVVPFLRGLVSMEFRPGSGYEVDIAEAFDLHPNDSEMVRLFAYNLGLIGQFDQALENFAIALELDPENVSVYASRAYLYMEHDAYEEAIADFSAFLENAPPDDEALKVTVQFSYAFVGKMNLALGNLSAGGEAYLDFLGVSNTVEMGGDPLTADAPVTLNVGNGDVYRLPVELEAGQVAIIRAASVPAGMVDPLIILVMPDGSAATASDDIASDRLDSEILDFEVSDSGTYMLVLMASPFVFSQGNVELMLTVS